MTGVATTGVTMTGVAMTGVVMTGVAMTGGGSVGPLPRPHIQVRGGASSMASSTRQPHHPPALAWTAVGPGLSQKVPFELVSAHLSCSWTCDMNCEELESTVYLQFLECACFPVTFPFFGIWGGDG